MAPRWLQDGSRWLQDGSKMAQDGSKMAPRWLRSFEALADAIALKIPERKKAMTESQDLRKTIKLHLKTHKTNKKHKKIKNGKNPKT